MMCFGGGGGTPAPPKPPAKPVAPKATSPKVQAAVTEQRETAAKALGQKGTILTGAMGETEEAQTAKKTLLGA